MPDEADMAQKYETLERRLQLAALSRVGSGPCGRFAGQIRKCADCGETIPPARLAAWPDALRCRDCQETRERTL